MKLRHDPGDDLDIAGTDFVLLQQFVEHPLLGKSPHVHRMVDDRTAAFVIEGNAIRSSEKRHHSKI